jgi:hypothetical protein
MLQRQNSPPRRSPSARCSNPPGLENAKGVLTTVYIKDPTDPAWKDDAALKEWSAFMDKYYPDGDKTSVNTVYEYLVAQTLVQVLKQSGDNLTRDNVMKQAASLKNLELGMLLPGMRINTGPNDFARSGRCGWGASMMAMLAIDLLEMAVLR